MDIDPLADRPPPRHAIESDSEDEPDGHAGIHTTDKADSRSRVPRTEQPTTIAWSRSIGNAPERTTSKLIIILEQVCSALRESFDFGSWEQRATINLGNEEIGQALSQSGTILLQLSSSQKVGIYSSASFARTILDNFPSKEIVILDTYQLPTYITTSALPNISTPPIRYLSTSTLPSLPLKVESFAPPNLLTSPTASFLSLAARQPSPSPSAQAPPAASISYTRATALLLPTSLAPEEEWDTSTLRGVLDCTASLLGLQAGSIARETKEGSGGGRKSANLKKHARIPESAMYI